MSSASTLLERPYSRALRVSGLLCGLALIALLGSMGVPLAPLAIAAPFAVFLWLAMRYPMHGLGIFLAFIPTYTLIFLIAEFFGPPYVGALEGADRVVLLLLVVVLWWRNRVKLATPDWILLSCFGIAIVHLIFAGSVFALLSDFNFIIAYAAGRVTKLSAFQETHWANRAIWIIASLAVLGMVEVFFIGEAPRTLLYLAVARGGTQGNALDAAFHGEGYSAMRESSTMFGPLQFAPLCVMALIVWWVYSRKPIPGIVIAAGLICSVTRSAWLGTATAVVVLGVMMGETKRVVKYGALMLALFVAAIPVLGLTDYFASMRAGDDPSAQGHKESLVEGVQFMALHPFGVGPGNAGKLAVEEEDTAFSVEDTYLTFAAEYGIVTTLLFVGFLASLFHLLRRKRTKLAYASIGIVVGFSVVLTFAALHDVFPLACWIWFPVGLAVRSATEDRGGLAEFNGV